MEAFSPAFVQANHRTSSRKRHSYPMWDQHNSNL